MEKYIYKDSGVEWLGKVPKHWKVDRIKDKTTAVVGGDWGNDIDSEADGKDIVVLRVADLDDIYFKFEDLTIRKIKEGSFETRKITDRTLIVEKSGGGEKQLVGRVGYPKGIDFDAICSNFMAKIEFDNTIDLRFANYLFSTLYKSYLNFPYVQQTTGIQNLNVNYYLTTKTVFPPFLEQKIIADYLDVACVRMDRIIAIKEEQFKKIESYYFARITECTTMGLDKSVKLKPIKSKWIIGIPEHWEVRKTKRVCKVFRGKFSHRPRNDPRFYDGVYPFIQTGNISRADKYITSYSQTLNDLGLSVSELFPSGTLTMTIAANIGDVAILTFDACFPDSIVGFKPYNNLDLEYLYYLFIGIKQDFLSTAIVTTQMNLNITRIGDVDCIIPPITEQKEIVNYLESLSKMVSEMKNKISSQIDTLKSYRKSLIHECVTGKKQVV
jgi:type I restriction enzyme S subunit